jgi:hypothetical protein
MADTKITGLTALAAADIAAADVFPVTDVSDTTQGASGTTKKITTANLKLVIRQLATDEYIYWGDPDTNGSWRLGLDGDGNFSIELRVAGSWVWKGGATA